MEKTCHTCKHRGMKKDQNKGSCDLNPQACLGSKSPLQYNLWESREAKSCMTCKHKVPMRNGSSCALRKAAECDGDKHTKWEYNLWELIPEKGEKEMEKIKENPSVEQSEGLIDAFDYINNKLFDAQLPRPMLIFTRNPKILGGYYSPNKWFNSDGVAADEIAINANTMIEGDEIELFQVLIHEMSHQWQHHFGTPGRGGYHNREWADKVLEIGLKPININDPDAETGDTISTVLVKGGKAMITLANMPEEITIPFYAEILGDPNIPQPEGGKPPEDPTPTPKPKSGSRTKYTCSQCGTNLWGRSGLKVMCLDCNIVFTETK